MNLPITIEILKRGDWYIARTPELDFISQGKTSEEAKKNLFEVIQIQVQEMKSIGTLNDYLFECGFETTDNRSTSHLEMMGFEKSVVSIS